MLLAAHAIAAAGKPAQPAWIVAAMRGAALVVVLMLLAIMGAAVFAAWRWAWSIGG